MDRQQLGAACSPLCKNHKQATGSGLWQSAEWWNARSTLGSHHYWIFGSHMAWDASWLGRLYFSEAPCSTAKLTSLTEELLLHVSRGILARFDGNGDRLSCLQKYFTLKIQETQYECFTFSSEHSNSPGCCKLHCEPLQRNPHPGSCPLWRHIWKFCVYLTKNKRYMFYSRSVVVIWKPTRMEIFRIDLAPHFGFLPLTCRLQVKGSVLPQVLHLCFGFLAESETSCKTEPKLLEQKIKNSFRFSCPHSYRLWTMEAIYL